MTNKRIFIKNSRTVKIIVENNVDFQTFYYPDRCRKHSSPDLSDIYFFDAIDRRP